MKKKRTERKRDKKHSDKKKTERSTHSSALFTNFSNFVHKTAFPQTLSEKIK